MLVSIFLNAFERTYEESGEVPRSRWLSMIANYHLIPYRNYNFTEDERDFAASEAMTKFELKHRPHLFFVPYIVGDIIEDVLDLVIGQIKWDDPSTWPESWHRGNRLADLD